MTFLEILAQRRVQFHRSALDPNEVQLCCMFCTDRGETQDTRFRLGVNLSSGEGHCFNCGWKSRQTVQKVLAKLGVTGGVESVAGVVRSSALPIHLPSDFQPFTASALKDSLIQQAYQYLRSRGLTRQQIRRKGLGISLTGRYAYRIIFPVAFQKRLLGLVARDFMDTRRTRYLNSPGQRYLYNLSDHADRVVLSEGVFKALTIEQATGLASAAILGHFLTPVQLEQLEKAGCRRVTIWPDPDAVGKAGAVRMARDLSEAGMQTSLVWPPPLVEADESSSQEIRRLLESSVEKYSWRVASLGNLR